MKRKEYRYLTVPEKQRIKVRIREWLAAPSLSDIAAEFNISRSKLLVLQYEVQAEKKQ